MSIVPRIPANRAVNNQGEVAFFGRTSFTYDEADDTSRCPAGKALRRKQLRRGKRRVTDAAEPRDLGSCAMRVLGNTILVERLAIA